MIEVMYQLKKERPDIHLIIMGVGSYSPNTRSVEDKINKYQLQENVTMLEWTSRDDILHIISHAQLYLSTARYEGLPYAVIEALALSKALVLSDVDGNKDLIDEDKNGFLIFAENTELFKQRILELLIYKEKRSSFEKHSYFLFNKYFNIGHTIKDLETIYKTESL
jgi:glycosyltransferase involved in cell wall biosynthesis